MSFFSRNNNIDPKPNEVEFDNEELPSDEFSSDIFSPEQPCLWPRLLALAVILVCCSTLIFFANKHITKTEQALADLHELSKTTGSATENKAQLYPLQLPSPVPLVDPIILSYMEATPGSSPSVLHAYQSTAQRDISNPIVLKLQISYLPQNCAVVDAILDVSTDIMFRTYRSFSPNLQTLDVELDFLNTNTLYYYRIHVALSDGTLLTSSGQFTTADTPRLLNIEGAYNTRDIGGWKTTDGQRIRQGLLYRGTELDGAVEPSYHITEKGRQEMLTLLGIRTDVDLRASSVNGQNMLDVSHAYYNAPMYEEAFTPNGQSSVRRIFSKLADPEAYPIYLHCTYGVDRTGTVCYLLESLLGVSEEDLLRDYELSTFGHFSAVSLEKISSFRDQLNTYEGLTAQEKAENFLLSCGVTQTEIDSLRTIFLIPE